MPAGVALVLLAERATARIAVAIYVVSLAALFGTSTAYHRLARSSTAKRRLRRLDHSMIYVLIAGTYTPVCLLALDGSFRWALLALVWAGAVAGVLLTAFALDRFTKLRWGLYLALGWAAVIAVPDLAVRPWLLALAAVGGILYTVGAVLFALHRPGRDAVWFGYHEYWHAFGVVAGGVFFAMNLTLITAA